MKKKKFSAELAYFAGLLILALGTALMERADFGLSMVVAPAYILHLKISQYLPFFSFGMAEYCFQALLLVVMMLLLRRVKLSYFFSFVTAVLYGFMLDGMMAAVALLPAPGIAGRTALFVAGMLLGSLGVSLVFHTYISPEVYELFVKEVSAKYGVEISRFKTGYDCVSCLVSIVMSFAFFGLWHFEGIKAGTVVCALINGSIIGRITRFLESRFEFADSFDLRKYF